MVEEKHKRPSWDEYFLDMIDAVAKRATCDRGRSGCVVVKDKRILCTGYVGSPPGLPHCDEIGHYLKAEYDENGNKKMHCIRTTHAEQNAICQAARAGVSLEGATIYCTMTPCHTCAKLIISVGIKRVVCKKRYHDADFTREMFAKAGVALEERDETLMKYENQ